MQIWKQLVSINRILIVQKSDPRWCNHKMNFDKMFETCFCNIAAHPFSLNFQNYLSWFTTLLNFFFWIFNPTMITQTKSSVFKFRKLRGTQNWKHQSASASRETRKFNDMKIEWFNFGVDVTNVYVVLDSNLIQFIHFQYILQMYELYDVLFSYRLGNNLFELETKKSKL